MRLLTSLAVFALTLVPAFAQTTHHPASTSACGPAVNGTLRCPRFGFNYKIPFGWLDRTDEMENEESSQPAEPSKSENVAKPETLLAIFERPPGAPGETSNSAVVIAAEPLSSYHAVKQPADYFGPIIELAEQRGFKVVNEPYAYSTGPKQLIRADFSKPRGNLTMWQSSLVVIEKGYIVSFTFLGGGEDEVEDLIENLKFSGAQKQVPHR